MAAPGIIHDGTLFHMFVQKDFLATGAGFEYLTSQDGKVFTRVNTALEPIPQSEEAGLYDPHPSIIKGERYIAYSGTPRVVKTGNRFISQPNIYLAKSMTDSWAGPWERKGKILDHTDIAQHHNQTNHQDYEWGIEGPQLIEFKDGKVLLNATCFLPDVRFGLRQKVFFALADTPEGPYTTLGPVLTKPMGEWDSGENGHAAGVMINGMLNLFYQARSGADVEDVPRNDWRYGIAHFNPNDWS